MLTSIEYVARATEIYSDTQVNFVLVDIRFVLQIYYMISKAIFRNFHFFPKGISHRYIVACIWYQGNKVSKWLNKIHTRNVLKEVKTWAERWEEWKVVCEGLMWIVKQSLMFWGFNWLLFSKYALFEIQSILVFQRLCIYEIASLLNFICNPWISAHGAFIVSCSHI